MEVTVSNQIIQVLDALCDKFGLAIDWGAQNVLPYAQELMGKMVSYELWTSVMWVTLSIVGAIACGAFGSCLWEEMDGADIEGLTFIAAVCVFGICLGGIVFQTMDIITCLTFPEKIVFEMMQSMMK